MVIAANPHDNNRTHTGEITITTEELINWSMELSNTIALKFISKGIAPKDAIPEASKIVKEEIGKLIHLQ